MMMTTTSKRKLAILILFNIFIIFSSACEDWVLAAKKFEFSQNKSRGSSEEGFSSLIPQLILENIAEGLYRTTTYEEMHDRAYNDLLVERQSLFLQLSKEVRVRDALVLEYENPRKLEREIKKQQKKIDEVQSKIDDNLEKCTRLEVEYREKVSGKTRKAFIFDREVFFDRLRSIFIEKKEPVMADSAEEKLVLYKKDSSELYVPTEVYEKSGPLSRAFENEMTGKKINGFIDGRLVIYGAYFSVECSVYIYPGKRCLGTITEVGSLRDCQSVVNRIASYFGPRIINRAPVELYFNVTPAECMANGRLSIDGIYLEKIPESMFLDSGKHSIKIECEGYVTRSVTHEFLDAEKFSLTAEMDRSREINLVLYNSRPRPGSIYENANFVAQMGWHEISGSFTSNGQPVIGQFRSTEKGTKIVREEVELDNGKTKVKETKEEGDYKSFFYYIPERLQKEDGTIAVRGTARDHATYIDKRRIWTYRAYSLVVISVPFWLYSLGEYNSAVRAYNNRSLTTLEEVNKWRKYKDTSMAVTGVCTGLFIYELARYLIAANSVLPVTVHKATPAEIERAEKKSEKYLILEKEPEEESKPEAELESQSQSESQPEAGEVTAAGDKNNEEAVEVE